MRDVGTTAFVIEVAPGGASERAGMRVGDFITRINGRTFEDVLQADAILRSGQVGRVTDYDILRDGGPLTLQVRLAAFGLRVPTVVMALAGLTFMGFGLWLGLLRPGIAAARHLALAFVLLGYALAVALLRRTPGEDPWASLQTASPW